MYARHGLRRASTLTFSQILLSDRAMDAKQILEASRASLEGTSPFPEIVQRLMAAGVEYYHVDYAAGRTTYYSGDAESVSTSLTFEGLPSISADFDPKELRAALLDSQRHGQSYRDFSRRAKAAGVQGYFVFLRGKRVTYWGRAGDQHTEWFPGAGPRPTQ